MSGVTRSPAPSWGSRSGRTPAEEALLELILEGGSLAIRFENACRAGATALRAEILAFRSSLLQHGHRFATHAGQHEETGEALFVVCHELLPDSPAAAWGRFRERVAERTVRDAADECEALEALLAGEYAVWDELVLAASVGHARLVPLAQFLRGELSRRGKHCKPKGFSDHVWTIVRMLAPESPMAEWDQAWADRHLRSVLRRVAEEYVPGDAQVEDSRENEEISAAADAEDRARYRAAVRAWVQAQLREYELRRSEGGA